MYLPVFKILESRLSKGSIIVADNVSFKETIPYLKYIKHNKKYVSTTLKIGKDDTELSFAL
jgi:predicted O-methyltransferase YrrM